jgi:streptogramin lyase
VTTVTRLLLALCTGAFLLPGEARPDALSMRFKGAIYQDDKEAALKSPEGVGCGDADLVVADTGNSRLVRFKLRDGLPAGATPVKLAELRQPTAVQTDAAGVTWVLDRRARKIGRVDAAGAFAGWLEVKGVEAPQAVLPVAFKLGASGGLVLLDAVARRVLVLDAAGAATRKLPLPAGEFADLAVDAAGGIYLLDARDATPYGAEPAAEAFKPLGKSMKDVLVFPGSVFATPRGLLLVADKYGHAIVTVGVDGSFQGRQFDLGHHEGYLSYPSAVCMNGVGDVYVADRGNNRVQVFATQR